MLELFSKLDGFAILIIISILAIFFIALLGSIFIRKKYLIMGNDINKKENRTRGSFEHSIFNNIIEDYSNAMQGSFRDINTQAII